MRFSMKNRASALYLMQVKFHNSAQARLSLSQLGLQPQSLNPAFYLSKLDNLPKCVACFQLWARSPKEAAISKKIESSPVESKKSISRFYLENFCYRDDLIFIELSFLRLVFMHCSQFLTRLTRAAQKYLPLCLSLSAAKCNKKHKMY